MRKFVTGLAYLTMLVGHQVSAQQENDQQKSKQEQQESQQQMIRGTVAGVTSIGEAVIDPQSNQAVIVEVNYLTVLGSPTGGEASQDRPEPDRQKKKGDSPSAGPKTQSAQNSSKRQNVYLVAISPDTKIRTGNQSQQAQKKSEDAGQQQNQAAFETLEIGDRVEIQFAHTERLQANAEGSEGGTERTAGFRGGDQEKKHGRNRIYVGQASEITIMTGGTGQQGQDREEKEGSNR